MSQLVRGRFAPSTTGHAHPGTLLAALLAWLDVRSRGGQILLRLEDLDAERCRPELGRALVEALRWLGLDFDAVETQSAASQRHHAALDQLAQEGALYACRCSRKALRANGVRAPDGSWVYPNTCRAAGRLTPDVWRASPLPLRARLPPGRIALADSSGLDLSQDPALDMGDPVVRRRDGAVAYQLAVVVDDAHAGITDVVRGRDIAPSTATQVALQRLLSLPTPRYRHHLLLLEPHGDKLAKLHGAVGFPTLRAHVDATALCGLLAYAAGITRDAAPTRPAALIGTFDWERVGQRDRVMRWDGAALQLAS